MKYKNEQARKWYLKNKKKRKEYDKIYGVVNSKSISKQKKKYLSNDQVREKKRLYNIAYRKKNRGKITAKRQEYLRNWEHTNRFKRNLKDFKMLSKQALVHKLTHFEYKRRLQAWSIIVRYNFKNRCAVCFAPSKDSHHIIFRNKYPELSFNLNNGISLCSICHKEIHKLNGY